jgi:hypothetical protein|tara:strand:- start:1777 stop:2055 length:279 start_codon:yes stop_codon:yes gene_type:complete
VIDTLTAEETYATSVRTKERMLGELKMASLYCVKEENTTQKKYIIQPMKNTKKEWRAVTSVKCVVAKINFVMTTTTRICSSGVYYVTSVIGL